MQLSDIRTEIRTRMGLSASDTNFTDAVLTSIINVALREVSTFEDWPWLEVSTTVNTAASTETVSLAAAVRKVTSMRYQYRELLFRPYRDRNLFYGVTGVPAAFSEKAGTWYIWPTPDAVYSLNYDYIRTEADLSGDTDEPLIPDWAVSLVIVYACVLCARRSRDRELEKVFYAQFADLMRTIKDDIRRVTLGHTARRIGKREVLG